MGMTISKTGSLVEKHRNLFGTHDVGGLSVDKRVFKESLATQEERNCENSDIISHDEDIELLRCNNHQNCRSCSNRILCYADGAL